MAKLRIRIVVNQVKREKMEHSHSERITQPPERRSFLLARNPGDDVPCEAAGLGVGRRVELQLLYDGAGNRRECIAVEIRERRDAMTFSAHINRIR